jgi:hypothetical protein
MPNMRLVGLKVFRLITQTPPGSFDQLFSDQRAISRPSGWANHRIERRTWRLCEKRQAEQLDKMPAWWGVNLERQKKHFLV